MQALPKLWEHQKECVAKARPHDFFALFMDPGVGKTATTITILREKYRIHGELLPTLILCPPIVISNWRAEITKYSHVTKDKIYLLNGTGRQRADIVQGAKRNSILITNYESLNMHFVYASLKEFLKQDHACLVLDESHKVKDVTAKRTKNAIELSDEAYYKYILTGTPILNNLMDIFSQFRVLDGGKRFGNNFFSFRAKYFEDKNRFMPVGRHFPKWEPIKGSSEKIKELISEISMHVEKASCLTLPPLVKKTIEVTMSKEQEKLYGDMRRDLVATIKTEGAGELHSIAELAITKALRLQQIVSGHIRVAGVNGSEDKTIQIKDNPRKAALRAILEEIAPFHKVIVWAVFHANYDDIRSVCKELEFRYVELHGLVSNKDEEARKFREEKDVRVLIGHPGSGGIGLNLVEASYMVYYSRSFSLEYDIQSEARCYRGGSDVHESVTRIDLVTPGTIDELVLKSLASKTAISNSVLKQGIGNL